MRGSCIDVVDSFRTLVDASTRHLDLPSTGNEDRATVIGCCNYANARIQPVSPKFDVMKTGDVQSIEIKTNLTENTLRIITAAESTRSCDDQLSINGVSKNINTRKNDVPRTHFE